MKCVSIFFILFSSIVFLAGITHGGKNKPYEGDTKPANNDITIKSKVIAADYKSLQDCVESIKTETGSPLKIITETPSQISGFLSNNSHFGCVEKVSDEKGTYVDGWYTVN